MKLTDEIDTGRSLELLENDPWPDAAPYPTSLVAAVHRLRKRPVGDLNAFELARLIGQDVGLAWLIPIALEHLRNTAPDEAAGGFYDEDLLAAAVTRDRKFWIANPRWAIHLEQTIAMLTDIGSYLEADVERFLGLVEGLTLDR